MAIGSVNTPPREDYLPLAGGTITGKLTVEGGITGNLEGKASSATKADTADKAANAEHADKADDAKNSAKWDGMTLRLENKASAGVFYIPAFTDTTNMDYIESRKLFEMIMLLAHPVGSIYQSTKLDNPNELFGGTWEAITGCFLFAADDAHLAGATGGEESHTLTTDELPSHNHGMGHVYQYDMTESSSQQQLSNAGDIHTTYTAKQTEYTGGGKAHNNMPPYRSVYVWQRIA